MPPAELRSIAQSTDGLSLNDHVAVRVVRISEALMRIATRTIEGPWGLKNTDLRLLNELDGLAEGLPVSEIARRVHVDKAWVSRSLREMETRGLVERRNNPQDSRHSLIVLSAEGQARLEEVRPHALRGELMLLEGLDARAFKTMLDRLETNAAAVLDQLS